MILHFREGKRSGAFKTRRMLTVGLLQIFCGLFVTKKEGFPNYSSLKMFHQIQIAGRCL